MTSQIVLMNKLGIALASDSALTIRLGDNRRTYGSAEKIFQIGPEHKVAVLHSGSTEFMGYPYEVLITEWRKTLTRPLSTLRAYADSFVRWLSHRPDLFSQEVQEGFVEYHAREYFLELRRLILERLEELEISPESWNDEETLEFVADFFRKDVKWLDERENSEGLSEKWADSIYSSIQHKIKEAFDYVFDDIPMNFLITEIIETISHQILFKAIGNDSDARLAFSGYGEEQIYPEHVWIELRGVVADKPRFSIDQLVVSNDHESWLQTHAQSEAIHTYLRAYHSSFLDGSKRNLRETITKIQQKIDDKLEGEIQLEIENELSEIQDQAIEELEKSFEDNSYNRFVKPFTGTLAGLPTTSLAKMAESLIELQILRQSSQAIQDTVGGPVDVAVITLENGFTWFRHKTIDQMWKTV